MTENFTSKKYGQFSVSLSDDKSFVSSLIDKALADMSADPLEMYEAQPPKSDGRRNNGGARRGTGPKPTPADQRKVRVTISLLPETKKRLVGYAIALDISTSEAADTLLTIMLSNADPHRL